MSVGNGQKEMVADICVFTVTNSRLEKGGIILHWTYRKNMKNKRALEIIYKTKPVRGYGRGTICCLKGSDLYWSHCKGKPNYKLE